MNAPVNTIWDGTERRRPNSCRRNSERRTYQERRCDIRVGIQQRQRGFCGWLRSLTKARLGVDRRKNVDQRTIPNRRRMVPRSMLTKEELADLLG